MLMLDRSFWSDLTTVKVNTHIIYLRQLIAFIKKYLQKIPKLDPQNKPLNLMPTFFWYNKIPIWTYVK